MPDTIFDTAADTKIPLGRHKGKTFDEVAVTDEGLLYLDHMRGKIDAWLKVREALNTYLDDPVISGDLTKLLKE